LTYFGLVIFLLSTSVLHASPTRGLASLELLTVEKAVAKALQRSPTLLDRKLDQESREITYENAWKRFYLPNVSLGAAASSALSVGQMPGSATSVTGRTALDRGTPASAIAVSVGEYTLYNFGRDKDIYELAKKNYERSGQTMKETERAVRFDTIRKFFSVRTTQDLLDVAQRSVESAEAIYELVKSRVPLGKATSTDLSSAEVDLINSKNALIQAEISARQTLWDLNRAMGEPIDRTYKIHADLKAKKLRMTLEEAVAMYKENSPAIKDAKLALESAKLNLRYVEKSLLPLPTLKFSGLTFGYTFGPTQTTLNRTTSNNGNFNITAAMSISIPLIGDGGFFAQRQIRDAEISVERAELSFRNAANQTEIDVRALWGRIQDQLKTINLNERKFQEAANVFDSVLQQVQRSTVVNRLEIKDGIEQVRLAEQDLSSAILTYYDLQYILASTLGVDELPEEP